MFFKGKHIAAVKIILILPVVIFLSGCGWGHKKEIQEEPVEVGPTDLERIREEGGTNQGRRGSEGCCRLQFYQLLCLPRKTHGVSV